jgi:hypothetical protein
MCPREQDSARGPVRISGHKFQESRKEQYAINHLESRLVAGGSGYGTAGFWPVSSTHGSQNQIRGNLAGPSHTGGLPERHSTGASVYVIAYVRSGRHDERRHREPFLRPRQRGGGQGMWSSSGQSIYAAKSIALIKYTTPPNQKKHNPGFKVGQQTISQNITFNDQSGKWSSTAAVTFTDAKGNVYRQGCAIASATRF